MKLLKHYRIGFTLIELLVVIAIIAILISVGAVSYTRSLKISRDSKRKTDIEQIRQALETYRSELGSYPATKELLVSSYINQIPTPPKATDTYTYTRISNYEYSLCTTMELVTPLNYCTYEP